jgi:archaellum biogenesis ATPase FlaH
LSAEHLNALLSKWNLLRFPELQRHCREHDAHGEWVTGLIPKRSLTLLAGHSGLGKSPLAGQLAVSLAAGVPFLDFPTKETTVVYLDFENGMGQLENMFQRISQHLGLREVPQHNLFVFSISNAPSMWGKTGCDIWQLICEVKPGLVIVDSLGSCLPEIEDKNSNANRELQKFREIMSQCKHAGTSIVLLHHLKKPSDLYSIGSLEDETPRRWFTQVRGASALVNGTDQRLGVDEPGKNTRKKRDGQSDVALVLRGFGRMRGEIPTVYLERVHDEEGDALGYRRLSGVDLLFNNEHEKAFKNLPPTFRFKAAQFALSKGASATKEFLSKCINAGVLRRLAGHAGYEKLAGITGVRS